MRASLANDCRFISRLALIFFAAWVAPLRADDFRIESRVYSGKQPEPVSRTTTLFKSGIVYDYIADAKDAAVFDKPHGRFLLVDATRRARTEVKLDQVLDFSNRLQMVAAKDSSPMLKFVAAPTFEINANDETGELTFSSPYMTYTLHTIKARSSEAALQFRDFSDWYARLNTMTNPLSNPPFPRLAVNDELLRRELLAKEVQLDIPQQKGLKSRSVTLRSEHHITWRLLQADLDKINQTETQLAAFKQISFEDYQQQVQVSKR